MCGLSKETQIAGAVIFPGHMMTHQQGQTTQSSKTKYSVSTEVRLKFSNMPL